MPHCLTVTNPVTQKLCSECGSFSAMVRCKMTNLILAATVELRVNSLLMILFWLKLFFFFFSISESFWLLRLYNVCLAELKAFFVSHNASRQHASFLDSQILLVESYVPNVMMHLFNSFRNRSFCFSLNFGAFFVMILCKWHFKSAAQ